MRDKLIFVMGLQRSGTTVLYDSLAQDSSLEAHPESAASVFYDQFLLRPERELRPIIWRKRRRLLLKPISEVQIRSVEAVLTEFQEYGPRVAWIYRDPVNVWASNARTFGYGEREFQAWLAGWNHGNQSILEALRGPFGEGIAIVRFEDLLADSDCFGALCRTLAIHPVNPLFRSSDRGQGRGLDEKTRREIEVATSETLAALDDVRVPRIPARAGARIGDPPTEGMGPWRLCSLGEHAVALESPPGSPEVVRLDVARVARSGVRIDRGPFPLRSPGPHGFDLWGRSDNPQSVRFAAGPAGDLGFEEPGGPSEPWVAGDMLVGPEWQASRVEFSAPSDQAGATLSFWAGRRAGVVELAVPQVVPAPPPAESLELEAGAGAVASLTRLPGHPSLLAVRVDKLGSGQPGDVRLVAAHRCVAAGELFAVTFRCRSDASHFVGVGVGEDEAPGHRLEHYQLVRVGMEWSTVRFEFAATRAGALRLYLELGEDIGTVEVDRAMFIDISPPLCNLLVVDGCGAALVFDPDRPDFTRIQITRAEKAEPHQIQLTRRLAPIHRGSRYGIEFRVRADVPRELCVGVAHSLAATELRNLGFYFEFAVSPAWKSFYFEFEPTADSDGPVLHFDLGQDDASVELHGARCFPVDSDLSPGEIARLRSIVGALETVH